MGRGWIIGLALAGLVCRAAIAADITIDATRRYQVIDGFGCKPAHWTAAGKFNTAEWYDMFYRDMGCSILRIELDWTAARNPVTFGDDVDADARLLDMGVIKNVGKVASESKRRKIDDFKVIASLWTPPEWMKYGTHQAYPNNSAGGHLKLDDENLTAFGRYVAAYCRAFEKAYGVPIYAVSIQNELAFEQKFNSCQYSPQEYVAALKAVGREFKRAGIKTLIDGPEDVGVGVQGKDWALQRQMSYIDAVNRDREAKGYLNIYSIHGYAGDGVHGLGSARESWAAYWDRIKGDAKRSWQTEASGTQDFARQIHEALVYGNCSAWVYWVMSAGSAAGEGLNNGTDTKAWKYCQAKHYFRYIRPGAVRVAAGPDRAAGINVSAFVHPAQKTLTIMMVNAGGDDTANITVPAELGIRSFAAYRTSGTEAFVKLNDVAVTDAKASVSIPRGGLVTLVGTGTGNFGK